MGAWDGESEAMTLAVDPTDVVRLTWTPGLRITEDHALEAMERVDTLNGTRERPLVVDLRGAAGITRDAQRVFARRCTASRVALVGESAVERVMANFAMRVITPPVPTRYFSSLDEALAWVRDGRAT